jgi:hypothetical protein
MRVLQLTATAMIMTSLFAGSGARAGTCQDEMAKLGKQVSEDAAVTNWGPGVKEANDKINARMKENILKGCAPGGIYDQLDAAMGHDRRQILWLGVTAHRTAEWIANQLTEACGWDQIHRYLIRDRDRAHGEIFVRRVRSIGIRDRPTSFRSPWQNAHAERLIRSIRRECTDHILIFGERHLRYVPLSYMGYYNGMRTHLSLNKNAPISCAAESAGRVICRPILGGLHHQYGRSDLRWAQVPLDL